jgi:hypothetical protein
MTIEEWLEQFRGQAAQLPGWQLREGKLRREDDGDSRRVWACPLMAQWNVQHPESLCPNSHPSLIRATWWPILTYEQIGQVMNAADYTTDELQPPDEAYAGAAQRLLALRQHLLAACGVEES